mmetsp:Transcript_58891/g.128978  ORF Transcript_58891/g.128978 Transcript_58891/m.128978 type:complete len:299 (+) Transcript_58891:640-1536(+)
MVTFCCASSSRFCKIFSFAVGLARSMNCGVIFFSVLSSKADTWFSCFSRRWSSLPTSISFSGTGMSTSISSEITTRMHPEGVSLGRSDMAFASIFSGSARASQANAELSALKASWKLLSAHQNVRGTRSFGGMPCSARALRTADVTAQNFSNQPSASASWAADILGHGLIINESGDEALRGKRCQTASVTKGMKGWSSFNDTSNRYSKTFCEVAASALLGFPPKCSCSRVLEASTYQAATSSCKNSLMSFVGGAKRFSSSAAVTLSQSPWHFESKARSSQGMALISSSENVMPLSKEI